MLQGLLLVADRLDSQGMAKPKSPKAPITPEEERLRAAMARYLDQRVKALGEGQSEFGRRCGIAPGDISAAIANKPDGKKQVSLGMLARVVTHLGPSMPVLLADVGAVYADLRAEEAKALALKAAAESERRRVEAEKVRAEEAKTDGARRDHPARRGPAVPRQR